MQRRKRFKHVHPNLASVNSGLWDRPVTFYVMDRGHLDFLHVTCSVSDWRKYTRSHTKWECLQIHLSGGSPLMQLSASPRGTEPRRAPEFAEKAAASEHLGNLKESQGSAHVSGPGRLARECSGHSQKQGLPLFCFGKTIDLLKS